MANRLALESSPYLLQHATNPVDWYPWGEEAFEKARREDRPVFLSVGYSTCHWCHVMAHESFESDEIARILNERFVPIKVDREERPDVDRVYMTFVQATTGAGGWPMSVWLTPELKPFYGGTYFPPASRWGRPGFADVLTELARLWQNDRARIEASAHDVTAQLQAAVGAGTVRGARDGAGAALADPDSLRAGVAAFRHACDARHGGFGGAPKFPRPAELLFLLAEHARTGDAVAREMALATLRAMALGGMRDHVGGGFHRYSVDARWRVPHFEKMLYDQAQLVLAYLEAGQASGDPFFAAIAADTLDYVRRDLTDALGGFYSAEDADSVPPEHASIPGAHKSEGAFYLWTAAEVDEIAGDDAGIARERFGISADGNAPDDPHGEFTGKNILYLAQPIEAIVARMGRPFDEVALVIESTRRAMFEARARRPRPHLDDKVLTAWNGLMIAAFARAPRTWPGSARAEGDLDAARRAAHFALETMWDERAGVVRRRYRAGEAGIAGYAEDYACLIWGLLELLQTDGDPAWLEWALRLQSRQDELFWDEAGAGWFSTTGSDASVLLRMKEDHDGAEPSASAVSALNHLVLFHLTGAAESAEKVERTLARLGPGLGELARGVPMMARVLSVWHAGVSQVVIVGDPDRDDTRRLKEALAGIYLPFVIVVPVSPGDHQARLATMLPWIGSMTTREGRAAAYVCRDFTCQAPVTTPEELTTLLAARDSGLGTRE